MNKLLLLSLCSLITITVVSHLLKIIRKAENDTLDSANEIRNTKWIIKQNKTREVALIITPLVASFFLEFNAQQSLVIYILSIASYFDLKRRWIPDPIIYALIITSSIFFQSSAIDKIYSITITLLIVLMINGVSHLQKKDLIIASGDVYIMLALALTLPPHITAYCISAMLSLSMCTTLVLRKPFAMLPVITVAYVLALLSYNHGLF